MLLLLSLTLNAAQCRLLAEIAPERYSPAAARWHAKFALRAKGISLDELQLALAALRLLPEEREGAALLHLARRQGLGSVTSRRL